jgi:localization factor PodJL
MAEAFRWLTLAAEAGASRAQAWLGTMYENGFAVPVSLDRARTLYDQAAVRGEFFGCIFLARLLASGKGGPVDRVGAARWYGEAMRMDVQPCAELEEARRFVA